MTETGTIIHGTLRLQDLIPAFLSALEDRVEASTFEPGADDPERVAAVGQAQEAMGEIEARVPEDDSDPYWDSEEAYWDYDSLSDWLSEFAPDGCYFGTLEGDASDFGFWPLEDPQEEEPIDWREQDEWAAQSERIENIRNEY